MRGAPLLAAVLLATRVAVAGAPPGALRDVNGDGRVIVVCFGDSTTLGSLHGSYPRTLGELLGGSATVVREGLYGDRVEPAKERLRGVLDREAADYVVLLLGVNDVSQPETAAACDPVATTVVAALRAMADEVRRRRAVPIVATIFISPRNSLAGVDGPAAARCAARINTDLRALPEPGVDFEAVMRDRYDELTIDGLHLNTAGARALAEAAARAFGVRPSAR